MNEDERKNELCTQQFPITKIYIAMHIKLEIAATLIDLYSLGAVAQIIVANAG